MRFPSEYTEGSSINPFVRSLNPGSQWYFHTQGEKMLWEVDCPALGHSDLRLNTVKVELVINEKYPQISGRYFYIPELDSPLFYSLRAAAAWAANVEFITEETQEEISA